MRHPVESEGAIILENRPMVGTEDLQLVAEGVLAAHGLKAVCECEAVIAKMIERGDKAGEENWIKILATVRQLQAPK
jgi:hypothetical protein